MQFNTLEKVNIQQLTTLFNKAFADYMVNIVLTPELLQEKISSENIVPEFSVGIFSCGEPVGFILHAIRKTKNTLIAYNAGTGVISEYRGQKATAQMYSYILPRLKKAGIKTIELEVIDKNVPAISSYINAGFKKIATLECLKGTLKSTRLNKHVLIKETDIAIVSEFVPFWEWQPTWQHSVETVQKSNSFKTYGAFKNNKPVAYAIYNSKTGRVAQFCVRPDYRRMGIGKGLLQFLLLINGNVETLSFINVDSGATSTLAFLQACGMNTFLVQHKMEMCLQ